MELKRAFNNKWFLIAAIIQICIVIFHVVLYVIPDKNQIGMLLSHYYTNPLDIDGIPGVFSEWIAMNTNGAKEILFVTLPIVAAIPYGASLYLDEKNKYVNNIAIRTNKKNFYISKMATLFISGGVIAVIPMVLSLVINLCVFPVDVPQACTAMYLMSKNVVLSDLFYSHPLIYTMIYILWVFLLVGLLSCSCFVATYVMENRFVIIIIPFIIYFVTYVAGSLFGSRMAYIWEYIQLNKFESVKLWQVVFQIILLAVIEGVSLIIKCSKKTDIL